MFNGKIRIFTVLKSVSWLAKYFLTRFILLSALIILFSSLPVSAALLKIDTKKDQAIEDAFMKDAAIEEAFKSVSGAVNTATVSKEESQNTPTNSNSTVSNSIPPRECAIEEVLNTQVKVNLSTAISTEKGRRGLFSLDFLVPLYYTHDKSTLLFYNPKDTLTTPFANEYNQGLGLRHIFDDSFILGVNSFFDRRLSHSRKYYSQVGIGLEYLSYPLDLRLNWYKPLTPPKVVDDSYELGSTHLIHYQNKEEPLTGYDIEMGFPIFDKYTKTRVFLGGFFFQSRLSKNVNGFRVRTETDLTDWFSLDATFNSKTDGQTEFIAGARFKLSFEWTNLFGIKKKSLSLLSPNTYLEDRLFDRVVRDLDIQSQSSAQETTDDNVELVYVDNTNSGVKDGSLTHPYPTLAEAFLDSRYIGLGGTAKYIYVFKGDGTKTGYTGNYTLYDNVILWGSGYDGGYKGIPTLGYPIIDGNASGSVVTLANNNTVMGCQIQNSGSLINSDGITGSNLSGTCSIMNNIITNIGYDGIYLSNYHTLSATISGNTLSNNNYSGIDLQSSYAAPLYATISGNTISGGSSGILYNNISRFISDSPVPYFNTISGNTITGNTYGIHIYYHDGANPVLDLGGGSLSSIGQNSIYNNTTYDVDNGIASLAISAQHNWWGTSGGTFHGNIDHTNPLSSNPN